MVTGHGLSERQLAAVRLLARGFRPSEIAEKLDVEVRTVRSNLYIARKALSIPPGAPVTVLVNEARRRGLLEE